MEELELLKKDLIQLNDLRSKIKVIEKSLKEKEDKILKPFIKKLAEKFNNIHEEYIKSHLKIDTYNFDFINKFKYLRVYNLDRDYEQYGYYKIPIDHLINNNFTEKDLMTNLQKENKIEQEQADKKEYERLKKKFEG